MRKPSSATTTCFAASPSRATLSVARAGSWGQRTSSSPATTAKGLPWIDHIVKIWARNDPVKARYALNWFASVYQMPWKKLVGTMVLNGGQGAGKGIIIDLFKRLLGDAYFMHVLDVQGTLLNTFQPEAVTTNLLTFLDEAFFGPDKRTASRLKGMLSEAKRLVNRKYVNAITLDNFSNFIVASNYFSAVRMENDDRRWVIIVLDNMFAGPQTAESKAYFDKILAVPLGDLARYLGSRDIRGFNSRNIPATKQGTNQKRRSADMVVQWYDHIASGGALPFTGVQLKQEETIPVKKMTIWDSYREFERDNNDGHQNKFNRRMFWDRLALVMTYKADIKKGRPVTGGSRTNCLCFPSLVAVRDQLRRFFNDPDMTFQVGESFDIEPTPAQALGGGGHGM